MYSIGYDIGSSSVKATILNIDTGKIVASDFYPKEEMQINSPHPGFAEQDPETWWKYTKQLTRQLIFDSSLDGIEIKAIGISYQMHGLVTVDKEQHIIRPSIIWCDSRAVEIGENAFQTLGNKFCLGHLLNSPGNFTASKLRWIKENEPDNYERIYKIMLPGDFIAMKLTGEINSTISGLSEGIFWDFSRNAISEEILEHYCIDPSLLPSINPTFSIQAKILKHVADELGISPDAVVSYRAGDQPNNAFSLNVLNVGDIAATAGTSGVVYGVIDKVNYDTYSRVNQFAHVNHTLTDTRLGVLLCINGTGIQNSWMRKIAGVDLSYEEINRKAAEVPIGSEGITVLPFGNGAERVLKNKNIGSQILGVDFNRHTDAHLFRASQEGIVFSFKFGIDIMKEMGLEINVIRAGKANMFLSPIFRQTLSNVTGATIELYDTDGAQGAARGAAFGAGYYKSFDEAFFSLNKVDEIYPNKNEIEETTEAYTIWRDKLGMFL
ncbi:MAG: FGGY family carbohydrate kinase [Ignavibacteria bacterium]|nr:FGGY family carbohydrate kinase [Ignavibacteria bacterium]